MDPRTPFTPTLIRIRTPITIPIIIRTHMVIPTTDTGAADIGADTAADTIGAVGIIGAAAVIGAAGPIAAAATRTEAAEATVAAVVTAEAVAGKQSAKVVD